MDDETLDVGHGGAVSGRMRKVRRQGTKTGQNRSNAMITTKGPSGPVVLKARVLRTGQRAGTPTTHTGVDAAIGKLDRRGHWWWLRDAALWQKPASLSENEQLAGVLNELADPDHPEHSGTSVITTTLGAAGVRHARDASASQGRLTERSWRFWSREAGLDPDKGCEPKPDFYDGLWADLNDIGNDDGDDQRGYVLLDDEREIFVGKP